VAGEGLGDILAREEAGGASDWVAKTRNTDGSMKATGSVADSKKRKAEEEKASKPMKVRHDTSSIGEGETVVMTLSDQRLIDKDGKLINADDELSNVRMTDAERAQHHNALKNQKEYDRDKDGQDILEKYDELKTGPSGFMIGGSTLGVIQEDDPEKRLAILTKLSEQHSLDNKLKLQSDFYTSEEMAKFRKPPKKKTKKRSAKDADKEDAVGNPKLVAIQRPDDAGSDEEDPELYEQLSKQRRLVRRSDAGATRRGEAALASVSERIQAIEANIDKDKEAEAEPAPGKAKDETMTATTEFCNVVQTPLEKVETIKHESFRGSTLYKQQATMRKGLAKKGARVQSLTEEQGDKLTKEQAEEEADNLKEDALDLSCASGLAYLRARDQIGCDQESHKFRKTDNRPLEMSTVDGDIKLEYRDDFGRVQTPKEAFRAISWKFHGKTPGRKNMERRILRLENEMRLKIMDPMTQLPTLRALRHVQSADAKPYMVLSGANEK
jgi:U4/U6.U5 tri-snRNP-associated protein 1